MDCSLPLTADTTSLCTFKCSYCFAQYQKLNNPAINEETFTTFPLDFEKFERIMRGKEPDNPYYKNFIKYKFPIHFGGLSDAFDYYEKEHKVTLKILKLLGELNYPTVFSTKGTIMIKGEWYEVLKKYAQNKNFVFQFSIITNNQEKAKGVEINTPTIDERFEAMKKLSDLGYWCVLRLRPYIIGISDVDIEGLFEKAFKSEAKSLSTEFFCYDIKMPKTEVYDVISKVCGFDITNYYKELSPRERGGYRRLNRDVKEKYVKQMWLLCKKYNIQFNISDPDFKELNQSGSCCGLPDNKQIFNSDVVNWSRGQLTNFVQKLMKKYLSGETELFLTLNDVLNEVPNAWMDDKKYWGDSLKCWDSHPKFKDLNYKAEFTQVWNDLNSPRNPYNYFHGLLKPIKLDENKNIIYKFNPPKYIEKWRKEGIL